MNATHGMKVCGEVRLRLSEFWDLPVSVDRQCFVTVECGADCYFRSGCFATEQLKDYESPVTVAKTSVASRSEESSAMISADVDWRDKPGTVRFLLRGRVSQGVRIQVWSLPQDVPAWSSDSSGQGLLQRPDAICGVPPGSVRVCHVSFAADSLRLSKAEYAGWLALYPQGCVYLRLLHRRKVGVVELLRLNMFGETNSTIVKMNSTRSNSHPVYGTSLSQGASKHFSGLQPSLSPWRDVVGTGYTPEAVDYLIDVIVALDRDLAKAITTHMFRGILLPCSVTRILGLFASLAGGAVVSGMLTSNQAVTIVNLALLCILSMAAVFPSTNSREASVDVNETVEYGQVMADRKLKRTRSLAKTLASQGGVSVPLVMIVATSLQALQDAVQCFRQPRRHWRSLATVVIVWFLPWTATKLWRVAVRIGLVLLIGCLTKYDWLQRLLANVLGTVLVLTSRQRQSVMAPLQWVNRNIPQGWETPEADEADHSEHHSKL